MSDDELAENYTQMINECINYYGENLKNPENGMLKFVIDKTKERVGPVITFESVKNNIRFLELLITEVEKAYGLMLKQKEEAENYTNMINKCIEYYGENLEKNASIMFKYAIDKTKEHVGPVITVESVKNNMHILNIYIPYVQKEYDLIVGREAANYQEKRLNLYFQQCWTNQ